MKHILITTFITLLALGMGCAWISPAAETASDGIQVHGHWTMTVTNPDGTLDAVHEFDNDLTYAGKHMLPALLSGELAITNYSIVIGQQTNPNEWSCLEESTDQDQIQPTIPYQFSLIPATADRNMLPPDGGTKLGITSICTVETLVGGNMAIDVVMALIGTRNKFDIKTPSWYTENYNASDGSVKQRQAVKLSVVDSYPASLNAGDGGVHFTSHSMDEPIPITNGQKIGITVKISFN